VLKVIQVIQTHTLYLMTVLISYNLILKTDFFLFLPRHSQVEL